MLPCALLVLFVSLGTEIQWSHATVVSVNADTTWTGPTGAATTAAATTVAPTTVAPTTVTPTTIAPTTIAPTTVAPTTVAPTTIAPTTVAPTTIAPTTIAPTTSAGNATTVAPTTVDPTTIAPTTIAPTTPVNGTTEAPGNVTTAAPATTTPTTVPTTTPTPTVPPPVTGNYVIRPDENSTACLLANFGLRLSFKQGEKPLEMNLDPNGTVASGICGQNTSDLVLTSDTITLMFTFTNETNKFHLHALNVTGVFSGANSNLSLWQAAVGSSYMCNKQQSFNITDSLTLYTFDLRVQPFAVSKGVFSTAEECFLDSDLSFLVPIAVGVALSFLIILVLISYLIGRRKSRTGYQSV